MLGDTFLAIVFVHDFSYVFPLHLLCRGTGDTPAVVRGYGAGAETGAGVPGVKGQERTPVERTSSGE